MVMFGYGGLVFYDLWYCVFLWVLVNDVMIFIEVVMRECWKICKGLGVYCSMVVKGRVVCDLGLGK